MQTRCYETLFNLIKMLNLTIQQKIQNRCYETLFKINEGYYYQNKKFWGII